MSNIMNSKAFREARRKAEEKVKELNLTEKIGQLSQFGTSIYTNEEKYFEDHFAEGKIGAYLTIIGAEKTNKMQKDLVDASRLHIPALFGDDVIHGFHTTFPSPLAQSCSWNPEVVRCGCEAAAKEAYRSGIKWTFSPMVEIARDPRWGRVVEGYGEDTYLCSRMSEAAVKGYQGEGETLEKDRVFANPKDDFIPDESTLYFGEGEHDAGMIFPKANQTVYIAEEAVVYGSIYRQCHNTRQRNTRFVALEARK